MPRNYKFEIEICPGCWEEIDPENLYDTNQNTLDSYENIDPEKLEGTLWWLSDLTQAPKCIRVIKK